MTKAVVVGRTGSVPALVAERAEKAAGYAEAAKASNTRRAYRSDWKLFKAWCAGRAVIAMPAAADTVLAYLIDHAGQLKVATLSRRLSAIHEAHLNAGYPIDTSGVAFRDVWRGIRRTHAAPQVQKAPLLTAQLRRTGAHCLTPTPDAATAPCCWSGSAPRSVGPNWPRWKSPATAAPAGSRRPLTASLSTWAHRKPIRKARAI